MTDQGTKILFPFVIKDDFSDLPVDPPGKAAVIDVSHWQGTVDYAKVYESGVRGVYIKGCEGMYYYPGGFEDTKYRQHMTGAGTAKLLRGVYHFARPQYSAIRQVDYFAPRSVAGELPPALDLETDGGLPIEKLLIWVQTFISDFLAKTGRRTIVLYTNGNFCQKLPQLAKRVHLWLSQPLAGGATNPRPTPILPLGWPTWHFYQYSWKGSVPGISTTVDLDWFNGSVGNLRDYASVY